MKRCSTFLFDSNKIMPTFTKTLEQKMNEKKITQIGLFEKDIFYVFKLEYFERIEWIQLYSLYLPLSHK